MRLLLTAFAMICAVEGAQLPSNFQKCNRNDADFERCLPKAAQNALAQLDRSYGEINLPNFKPRFVAEMSVRSKELLVDIEEHLYNSTLYGFTDGKVKQFAWDFQRKEIKLSVLVPRLESFFTSKIDGRIAVFPVHSYGPDHQIFTNFLISYSISYKETVRNSQTYVDIVNTTFDGSLTYLYINIENIVPGHKLLSLIANFLINLTWPILYNEIKQNYWEEANRVLRQMFEGFFAAVSIEDMFD